MRTLSKRAALAGLVAAGLVAALTSTALAAGSPAGGQVVLAAGQTGTAAQVPWQRVRPAWELVQYNASTNTAGHIRPRALTLYLVDPAGGRYRLFRWAGKAAIQPVLADWSGDKTRALFTQGTSTLQQLTLRTGKVTTITLRHAGLTVAASYTRPTGSSLLVTDGASQTVTEYSLHGTVLRHLGKNSEGAIQSADGAQFVLPGSAGLRLTTSTGRFVRSLPVPGRGCEPLRYWNASTILASCAVSRTGTQTRLWLVPASGATPSVLTSDHLTPPDLGNLGAWRLPNGLYLQAGGACGALFIARQHSNGSTSMVTVPGTNGTSNQVVTAKGSRLLVDAGTGCTPSNSLLWFNPATHAEQWLVSTPHTVLGVMAVVPFYSRENQRGF